MAGALAQASLFGAPSSQPAAAHPPHRHDLADLVVAPGYVSPGSQSTGGVRGWGSDLAVRQFPPTEGGQTAHTDPRPES